jgi:predicted transcriptional regulator
VLAMISRKNGVSLEEIMEAMGCQKHTIRGFIAIFGRTMKIERFKNEAGARTYKAA